MNLNYFNKKIREILWSDIADGSIVYMQFFRNNMRLEKYRFGFYCKIKCFFLNKITLSDESVISDIKSSFILNIPHFTFDRAMNRYLGKEINLDNHIYLLFKKISKKQIRIYCCSDHSIKIENFFPHLDMAE